MPRVRIGREFTFDASHKLDWHDGACKQLHGHTYRLLVEVSGDVNSNGIVWDLADLKATVEHHVIRALDHRYLNDLFNNPTAELMAKQIWTKLTALELPRSVAIETIRIYEGGSGYAEVRRSVT